MSILSWNGRGAGSTETVQELQEIRRKYFPDFLFLMETKQKLSYMEGLKKDLGYDDLVTVEPEGLSGGLAVMWKKNFKVEILVCDKRIVDCKVGMGSLSFFLTCVYGDPVVARRRVVWDRLMVLAVTRDEAWVLVGDFNELLNNEEKSGGAVRVESSFWDFWHMTSSCKLRELRSFGNSLSWAGWRDRVWVQCRLDRSFGNDEWYNLFPRSQVEYMDMLSSDHRPIKVCFSYEPENVRRGRFFFDRRMLGKDGIEEAVRRGWAGGGSDVGVDLMERISNCRKELARWKKSSGANSQDRIVIIKSSLQSEIARHAPDAERMRFLKRELSVAYR
ncbi:BnaC04g13250D [Brassica napus]|uniref:BnaC04g13250D protein n=2 Tax=Brassica TaxID=3705 RepID=A0A078GDV1_BRANA|nr:BnaC04g13250D [Brassica napus]VDD07373.1 unnamed protein product [Brassica oleracea]